MPCCCANVEPIAFHNSYFGDGYGPILYSNVSCGGWEQVLQTALKLPTPPLSVPVNRQLECSVVNVSGLISSFVLNIKTSSIDCNDGDIRLVEGHLTMREL